MNGIGRASSGNTTGDRVAVAGGASECAVGLGVAGVVGVADGCGELVAVGDGALVGGTGDNVDHSTGVGADSVGSGVGETPLLGVSISGTVTPIVHTVTDKQTSKQGVAILYMIMSFPPK